MGPVVRLDRPLPPLNLGGPPVAVAALAFVGVLAGGSLSPAVAAPPSSQFGGPPAAVPPSSQFGGPPAAVPPSTAKTSSLSWVRLPGTESCLSTPELSTRVDRRLGRGAIVSPSVADISIEARAEYVLKSKKIRVVISGFDRQGASIGLRELEGNDCKNLESAIVLVISLMIDPDAVRPPSEPASPEPPPPVPSTSPVVPVVEAPRPSPFVASQVSPTAEPLPKPWGVHGAGGFLVGVGVGPLPNLGATFGVTVGPPASARGTLSFAADLIAYPLAASFASADSSSALPGRSVSVGGYAATLSLCPSFSLNARATLRAGVCAGLRTGVYVASGHGYASSSEARALLLDAVIAPHGEVDLTRQTYVFADARALVPFVRPALQVSGAPDRVVFTRPPVGAEFAIGLGIHFSP